MTKTLEVSPTVKTLTEARRVIEHYGWCQYQIVNHLGQRCIYGALMAAGLPAPREPSEPLSGAEIALCRAIGVNGALGLVLWNNRHGRTKEEVVASFDRAIAIELGLEQP